MKPFKLLSLAAALAVCTLCACSRADGSRAGEEGILMSMQEALARPADFELPGPLKVWAAERSSEMGVYYVLSDREVLEPARTTAAAQRLVLFKGRAELRVGDMVKASGPGTYAVVPPGAAWRLKRSGPEPLLFSLLVTPDAAPTTLFGK